MEGKQALELPARIRAASGATRDDGWIRVGELPLRQRLGEAGLFLIVGLGVGAALLFVPLVHILGILFALALTGVAGLRLRAARVLEAARGVCPNCSREGPFYVGFGRRRFRVPAAGSCQECGIQLTLAPLPSAAA
jgi:hypothetical protein